MTLTFEQTEISQITGHPEICFKIVDSAEDIVKTYAMFVWIIELTDNHLEFTITQHGDIKERFILTHSQVNLVRIVLSAPIVNKLLI